MAVKLKQFMLNGGTLTNAVQVAAGGGLPIRVEQTVSFPGTADYSFTFSAGSFPNGATLHSVIFPGNLGRSDASGDDQRKVTVFYDIDGGGFTEVSPGDFDLNVPIASDEELTIRAQFEDDSAFDSSIAAWISDGPIMAYDDKADPVVLVTSVGIGGRFLG